MGELGGGQAPRPANEALWPLPPGAGATPPRHYPSLVSAQCTTGRAGPGARHHEAPRRRLTGGGGCSWPGAGGCGGTDGSKSTANIGSFSLIEVGKTHVQVAADGASAVVKEETGPPTVCAIAYGKTASLGSIADDPNMGGTGITHHVVVLGNLSPGTTYRFRLTATDARGRVFQTPQLATFTTPRAARPRSKI